MVRGRNGDVSGPGAGKGGKKFEGKVKGRLKKHKKGADLIPLFTRAFFRVISRALPCPEGSLL